MTVLWGNFAPRNPAGRRARDATVASVPRRRDLLLITLYAAVLAGLAGLRPLWLDEVLQLIASTQPDLGRVIRWVTYNPGGAPLGYLAQRVLVLPLGLTPWTARAAPAAFSVLSACVLVRFARDLKVPTSVVSLGFILAPLQLRYAVEGRPYSQALFFALAALWCLWRLAQSPSLRLAAAYAALVALGLYTQPLSAAVQLGALGALAAGGRRRAACLGGIAFALVCLSFTPWYLYVKSSWHSGIAASHFTFAAAPHTLWMLMREISGGGFVASLSLLGGAALGWRRAESPARWFFVLPPLLLLAAAQLPAVRSASWQSVLPALFLAGSIAGDVRYFRSPGEDWPGAARALLAATNHGACAVVPNPQPKELYQIFEPALSGRFCSASRATGPAVVVLNRYTLPSSSAQCTRELAARGFRAAGETGGGGVRLVLFVPAGSSAAAIQK